MNLTDLKKKGFKIVTNWQDCNKNTIFLFDSKNQTKDTMMGWNGGSNTISQIQLQFKTKDDAINYAKSNDLDYEVLETSERKVISKSYADNFK